MNKIFKKNGKLQEVILDKSEQLYLMKVNNKRIREQNEQTSNTARQSLSAGSR